MPLRFPIGTEVLANIAGKREPGVIVGQWHDENHPYRIKLHNYQGREIVAPWDVDPCVCLNPNPPPTTDCRNTTNTDTNTGAS